VSLRDLFLLDPDLVFLNHGSFGACPRPVFERYQAWQRELEASPVEFLGRRFEDLLDEARAALAVYVGAQPGDLVFCPNATSGVNAVARSLRLEHGDEILSTDHEYGALDLTWEFVCDRTGARYVRQPVPTPVGTEDEIAEAVWAGFGPRTRVLYLSHITSRSAVRFPVEELCRRAREAGVVSIVDGAHAVGQIPIDLASLGADFYAGNCHKWLCAPKGAGFLWARPEHQTRIEPATVTWGYEPGQGFGERRHWQGTRDPAAYLSVPAAIEFQREHGWDDVRERCRGLLDFARESMTSWTGLEPLGRDPLQMATFPLPPCDGDEVKRRLFDEHRVEVPVWQRNGATLLRISVQGYNDAADIEALVGALPRLI
jgi:isopenicillin-N epimerase